MYLHMFTSGLLAPTGIAPEETKYTGSIRLALKLMNANDLQGLIKAEWGRLADILKKEGRTVDAHYYPAEGHGFVKRENQIDALRRTVEWFDKYLKGQ